MFTVTDMIRLVGNVPNEGRLEIYHENKWGTVCDDGFDEMDEIVVCRQLGYTQPKNFSRGNSTTPGKGSIWLDEVECTSSHVRLSQCSSRGWGVSDCHHSDDVSVACEGKSIRLQNAVVVVSHTNCVWELS